MKNLFSHTPFSLMCSILFWLAAFPQTVFSDWRSNSELISSVLLISSLEPGNPCATGFVTEDGDIITNAHVTRSLCTKNSCANIRLRRSASLNALASIDVPTDGLELAIQLDSLDISVLRYKSRPPVKGVFNSQKPQPALVNQKVLSLGFPACQTLTASEGEIISKNSLVLKTNLQGKHGSSGSPVFTPDYALFGIVAEASSPIEAAFSLLLQTNFALSALDWDVLARHLKYAQEDSQYHGLAHAITTLLHYWSSDVLPLTGTSRIKATFDYLGFVSGLTRQARDLNLNNQELRALFLFDLDPVGVLKAGAEYLPFEENLLVSQLQLLALSASLEMYGPFKNILIPLEQREIDQLLTHYPESQSKAIVDLINKSVTYNAQGLILQSISWGFLGILVVALFASIWGFTMGYAWTLIKGKLFTRIIKLFFIGLIFWPFSLFFLRGPKKN